MALRILTTDYPIAFAGEAYYLRFQVAGGTAPYTYATTGLPAGMTLNSATGELTATVGAILGTEVGSYALTLTCTDAASAVATLAATLVVRPASFRRATSLVVDPSLESLVNKDQAALTRERITSHFSDLPDGIRADLSYIEDTISHWSSEVLVGSPGDDATVAADLNTQLAALASSNIKIGEPQILSVAAFTSTTTVAGVPQVFIDTSPATDFLDSNDHLFITEYVDGPVYDVADATKGYPAVVQKITPVLDADITALTLYMSRAVDDQAGNILVTICRADSPTNIQLIAGTNALAYGDGTQILGSGIVPVASIPLDATRTSWLPGHQVSVPLTAGPVGLSMTAGSSYYIVVSSDYTTPGPNYVQVAASIDPLAGNLFPSVAPRAITATPGIPNSAGSEIADVAAPFELSPGAQKVWSMGLKLDTTTTPTTGTVVISSADKFLAGQVYVLMTSGLHALEDASDNPVLLLSEADGSGGTTVDANGFYTNTGLTLQLYTPNTGQLPPVPFKVLAAAERDLNALAADALMQTVNLDTTPTELVLKSPDGQRWQLSIDNSGVISGTKI